MQQSESRRPQSGFTLIELMVTVAVLVILLAVAIPSMSTFVSSQRVKTSSFDVYAALMYARSEAIKRRSNVSVVSATTDWSSGWTVQDDATAAVLRSQDATKGVVVTASTATITYKLDGRLATGSALVEVASQTNSNQAGRRCLSVDTTGLPKSRTLTGSATCP
ncbi:MAG: GspH/FimT family pseudopilin [Caldimonas sp.]